MPGDINAEGLGWSQTQTKPWYLWFWLNKKYYALDCRGE